MGRKYVKLTGAARDYADVCSRWATIGEVREAEKRLVSAAMMLCGYQEHKGEWKQCQGRNTHGSGMR